jgi:hypothetical protein
MVEKLPRIAPTGGRGASTGGRTGGYSPIPAVASCYACLYEVIGVQSGLDVLGLNALSAPGRPGKDGVRVVSRYKPGAVVVALGVRFGGAWVLVREAFGSHPPQWLCAERGDGVRFLRPYSGPALRLVRVGAAPALSLRDWPAAKDSSVVGLLPHGTVCVALGRRGRWIKVKEGLREAPPEEGVGAGRGGGGGGGGGRCAKPAIVWPDEWLLGQNVRTGEALVAGFELFVPPAPERNPGPVAPAELRAAALRGAARRQEALLRKPKHAFLRRSGATRAGARQEAQGKPLAAAAAAGAGTAAGCGGGGGSGGQGASFSSEWSDSDTTAASSTASEASSLG